jgi:hypothetical protein
MPTYQRETPIDAGTHPTGPADVLPIPYRSNRSGPTGLGNLLPTPPISNRAACTVRWQNHGAHRICKGWSKDRVLECGTYTDQRPCQRKTARALECRGPASERPAPASKKWCARWYAEDLHPNSQRSRQRNGARAGMLKNLHPRPRQRKRRARRNVGRTQHALNKQTNKRTTT